MLQYRRELEHGIAVSFPLHKAASDGDIYAVRDILASFDDPLPVNAPDAEGRSAIFYAQIRGFQEITDLLESVGWTKMPEGNTFRGAGGRLCFWEYDGVAAAAATLKQQPSRSALRFLYAQKPTTASAIVREKKKTDIALRHANRKVEYGATFATVGKGHTLYSRKAAGTSRYVRASKAGKAIRPALNVRDYAAGHHVFNQRLRAATEALQSDAVGYGSEEEDEKIMRLVEATATGADGDSWEGSCASARTLANVARFVVDRKPTRSANGAWVVIQPSDVEEEEDAYMPVAPSDDVLSVASSDVGSLFDVISLDEWPTLSSEVSSMGYCMRFADELQEVPEEAQEEAEEREWNVVVVDETQDERQGRQVESEKRADATVTVKAASGVAWGNPVATLSVVSGVAQGRVARFTRSHATAAAVAMDANEGAGAVDGTSGSGGGAGAAGAADGAAMDAKEAAFQEALEAALGPIDATWRVSRARSQGGRLHAVRRP